MKDTGNGIKRRKEVEEKKGRAKILKLRISLREKYQSSEDGNYIGRS